MIGYFEFYRVGLTLEKNNISFYVSINEAK